MKIDRIIPAVIAASSILLFGCPPKETTGAGGAPAADEIAIGHLASMTGGQATFGQQTDQGIKLALEEINAKGGVKGRKVRVITEDTQSKQEEAANAASKLISRDNVTAILGEIASSNSLAAGPIAQLAKIPMISPGSTNPAVTEKGDYIFRICFIDPYQGEALANYVANTMKLKRAAILRDVRSDYSMGLSDYFKNTFEKLGGKIVVDSSYSQGDSDFKSQLTTIKGAKPEVIFVPGYYTEIGQIAVQARDLGITVPLVGGDGWESPKLIEIGGKSLEGSFYSNHYHVDDPSPAVRDFVVAYQKKYGTTPDAMAALGYDSMKFLAAAMERAPSLDGPALRDEIAKSAGFQGVTGTITLGPDRNPLNKKLVVLEIKDGKLVLRATVDPAADAAAVTAPVETATAVATETAATK
ncbi:MAG: ABC transporter substrate-binding protein [Thermoanaerobaculia bacterium]|nr:ABC transporter substrate-binding protein [Thermoanaerobaculia bacterium]